MLSPTHPTLSDGTKVADLVDVATRQVQMRALSDPELYELEMEQIFGKIWVFLGHESEIPNSGDFITRDMGSDSVLITRDKSGEVHVMLNVCAHRGMRISTLDAGNTQIHTCIYHGWAFRPNGAFLGAPVEKEAMHGKMMSKDELGLKKARVTLYGGLIFATWNIEGPSFDEFLGDAKWYYDILFKRSDKGMEVLGPPQRFTVRANWKAAGEQSAADGYHTLTLHRWLGEVGNYSKKTEGEGGGGDLSPEMYGVEVSSPHGHALRCIDLGRKIRRMTGLDPDKLSIDEKLNALPPAGMTKDMVEQLKRNLTPEQLQVQTSMPPQVGGIFPNVLFGFVYIPQADGTVVGSMTMHAYVPKGPDKLEFVNWIFAEKDAPQELREKMLRQTIQLFGTSGMVEQDDSDTWPHMTLAAKGAQGKKMTLKYQAAYETGAPEGWPGPGIVNEGFTKDDTQWHWWMYWRQLMGGSV
ncbi:aromatic ring-hydroxylating dioxygenase subunit alpha [Hydrogenophaga sp.]|uniref:aromatic ring-hydroxylating dioxygenase subunit alpha n=1 Tax=Hydrogenophaga sp. TaxID=1904254 RepID=UPI0027329C75|nr:aromatic ring-hydroxylating dioxygenase subunit alpha [Hydrogenophaga sp.]MDP3108122.1 aromatic ring-hydroxylating dioxygenase subunit alpha [Hydrogenophaga sp.]MDZ4101468.1 aromatic ring-hydroxylating dioxygenase subunit alpha [Hydrogenophaga sp.]